MKQPAISVDNLTVKFGDFRAVDDLSLQLEPGSVHGFLGPNGAGKSTTIRTLLGLLKPDEGSVSILGVDPHKDPKVLSRIGYVPGDVALWPNLTGGEVLSALAALRGRPSSEKRQSELIDAFALDTTKKTRDYSTGNRRKVSLIAALSIDAEVLILDEPTAGLDPLMEEVFVTEIQRLKDEGTSVLLSSHILSEVEKLCDYVTVIKDGQVVESGLLSQLRHLSSYTLTAHMPDGETREVTAAPDDITPELQKLIDAGGQHITSQPASLETIFLQHYDTAAGERSS